MSYGHCYGCCKLCEESCTAPVCYHPCEQNCVHSKDHYLVQRIVRDNGKVVTRYDFTPLLGVKHIKDAI